MVHWVRNERCEGAHCKTGVRRGHVVSVVRGRMHSTQCVAKVLNQFLHTYIRIS